jgi:putative sterol carrier protein
VFSFSSQLDGQKAYMTGKLKTKGNMMLATKLGAVLGVSHSLFSVRDVELG